MLRVAQVYFDTLKTGEDRALVLQHKGFLSPRLLRPHPTLELVAGYIKAGSSGSCIHKRPQQHLLEKRGVPLQVPLGQGGYEGLHVGATANRDRAREEFEGAHRAHPGSVASRALKCAGALA